VITLEHVRQALHLPHFDPRAAHMGMSPVPRGRPNGETPRQAGVLALLFPQADSRLHVLLTRRNDNLRGHSGQISFPGGRRDEDDPDFTATALRETCEELGLCDEIAVLGHLSQIFIPPSNFNVYPTVGYLPAAPAPRPNPDEVAEVFSLGLDDLLNPSLKQTEMRTIQGYQVRVPYYSVQGHKVWGATAVMLGELEARLRIVTGLTYP
jgi:8-oxo-dGTP pyrophosphatase MutT (NUDIX family)